MDFHFTNLGPIADGQLRLGDLTLIVGKNNTGKTYVTYALYGILKSWPPFPSVFSRRTLHGILAPVIPEGLDYVELTEEEVNKQRTQIAKKLSAIFSHQTLPEVFNTPNSELKGAAVSLAVTPMPLSAFPSEHQIDENVAITNDNTTLTISRHPNGDDESRESWRHPGLVFRYLSFLFPEIPEPFILTSERFGISLFYKELDFARSEIVELLQNLPARKKTERDTFFVIGRGTSRYARPIKDNIDYTRSIPDRTAEKSALTSSNLVEDVQNLMGGHYKTSGDNIRFASPQRREAQKLQFDIPIHIASSSARGLSDLYFFLKHEARQGQLLIMDEPESHLDTENQIRMARLLARAVRSGMKVMVTTHSDYFVKEINNLVMLSQEFEGKSAFAAEYGYAPDEYLEISSVEAYTATGDSLVRCEVDEFGFTMPIFDDTIDMINRISDELGSRIANR